MIEYSNGGFITAVGDRPARDASEAKYRARDAVDVLRIGGYATRYLKPHPFKGGIDVFVPGAFTASLAAKNVVRLVEDHDDTETFASTNCGGLELRSDDVGLAFLATLPNTPQGRRAYDLVQSHKKTAMSVKYHVLDSEQKRIEGSDVRFIRSANLSDVSLCRHGAVKLAYAEIVTDGSAEPNWKSKTSADISGAHARLMQALQDLKSHFGAA